MDPTNPNLDALLQKIAAEQHILDPVIEVTPISSGGANYSSRLYLAKITGKDDSLNLFVKIASISEEMRKLFQADPYNNERMAYTTLLKTFRQLEEKHNLPEEFKLILPKYYGADAAPLQEILVLEDLTSGGFGSADRFHSVNWQYAVSAITELAKFHALSIAYEHDNPNEYNKINYILEGMFPDNEDTQTFFKASAQTALEAVYDKHKNKLKKFMDGVTSSTISNMNRGLKRSVLIHADFRPSNMLHRTRQDGSVEVIPVDYQTIQKGSPVMDLFYFICCATDGPFRAKYYQALIDHYYSELSAALARLHLDVEKEYSREDFEFDLKEKLPYSLVLTVMGLPILTVHAEDAPSLGEEFSMSTFAIKNTGSQYPIRLNEAVEDYVAWGILTD